MGISLFLLHETLKNNWLLLLADESIRDSMGHKVNYPCTNDLERNWWGDTQVPTIWNKTKLIAVMR